MVEPFQCRGDPVKFCLVFNVPPSPPLPRRGVGDELGPVLCDDDGMLLLGTHTFLGLSTLCTTVPVWLR